MWSLRTRRSTATDIDLGRHNHLKHDTTAVLGGSKVSLLRIDSESILIVLERAKTRKEVIEISDDEDILESYEFSSSGSRQYNRPLPSRGSKGPRQQVYQSSPLRSSPMRLSVTPVQTQ